MPHATPDLIILGGGLAGGLAVLALAERRPELNVTIVEAGDTIGGNHLWSFFDSDIAASDRWLVDPLIVHRWPGYDVRFPDYTRTFGEPYQSIESERLDAVVRATLSPEAIVRATVTKATPTSVMLSDGRTLETAKIIDMRGSGDLSNIGCGWQKFVGQALSLAEPHGLDRPVIMDATVTQAEGYRFVYLLPLGPREMFVEDTYYSDTPDLDAEEVKRRISAYAKAQGWIATATNRLETGVLPVVTSGAFEDFWPAADRLARGGVRAGLFQPLTSYSLPDAVRFAAALAKDPSLDTRAWAERRWRAGAFERLLGRMLFKAANPPDRYRVLQRFYRLPAPLIARFYAGRSTVADKLRVLAGKPPVPVGRAIRAIMEKK
jgi:lycopene beta-cyclase